MTPQRLPEPRARRQVGGVHRAEGRDPGAEGTRVLIAPLAGVGRDYPLSIEKLAPILSWYVVKDWREGCERCIQILRYGGMGHTMSIHSKNDDVILQFGLKKPAFRICVNTPTTHGSIGLTTGLDPAMTLGCGGWGGNITSDNITPRHLLNVKRLAYEVRPAVVQCVPERPGRLPVRMPASPPASLPHQAPARPGRRASRPTLLADRIDRFLASRGFRLPAARQRPSQTPGPRPPAEQPPVGLRLRGGRPGGHEGWTKAPDRRKDHHHPLGAGPRRGPEGVRPDGLAALTENCS